MARLAEIIRTHHAEIIALWTKQARQAAAARGLDQPEVQNVVPAYLLSLAAAGDSLGEFTSERREQVANYLSSRLRQGFQLAEIVEEFALLGRCIAAMWSSNRGVEPPSHLEVEHLFEELHVTSAVLMQMFTRHMMEDEQTEKQILRLIQDVANAALKEDPPSFEKRLQDVLALVMEAMGSQCAAMRLYNPETGGLQAKAAVGVGREELEQYATTVAPMRFAEVAATAPTASTWDATVTALTVSDELRRSGINSLLAVRLPPRYRLLAVVYVGLAETRAFTPREIHRIESIGHDLTVHLDNARLFSELHHHVAQLDSERELRERFVSILAHDLRGPLTAAKMSAQLLIEHPERLDERRDLAMMIDRNLERADRMIRDLLDANRIRAGERLSLQIDECDLGIVARDVFEDLVATYGERFTLDVEEHVNGFWSAEELRRALWNLATNAVKYGASDKPITLRVRRTAKGAQASVHNWGRPISNGEKNQLFRPFSRTHAARVGGQKGWGLGLTLVLGCAEAHGGHVTVESTADSGTTFTIDLPHDSRAVQ